MDSRYKENYLNAVFNQFLRKQGQRDTRHVIYMIYIRSPQISQIFVFSSKHSPHKTLLSNLSAVSSVNSFPQTEHINFSYIILIPFHFRILPRASSLNAHHRL